MSNRRLSNYNYLIRHLNRLLLSILLMKLVEISQMSGYRVPLVVDDGTLVVTTTARATGKAMTLALAFAFATTIIAASIASRHGRELGVTVANVFAHGRRRGVYDVVVVVVGRRLVVRRC